MAYGIVLLKPNIKPKLKKSRSCILGKKSWISSHGSAHHSQLRYDSQHRRITVQWCHQPINRTKLWFYLDALVAFTMLLVDPHSNIDNSAYLHIHWAKNEFLRWIQFSIKKWIFGQLYKSPFTKNSAPAVFLKASHLNTSPKFSTLLSNRGAIAELS